MNALTIPDNIRYLVCSDFDETFFAHDLSNKADVLALDAYIASNASRHGILFGIISASTKAMIEHCFEIGHFKHYPHFISTNSGTEIYYFKNNEWVRDETYHEYFKALNFDKQVILDIEAQLKTEGIKLITQKPFIDAPFSRNYYYESIGAIDNDNIARIKELGSAFDFNVNVSKCNPLIGDPEGYFDVDFFPSIAGKHAVVKYLMAKYNIHQNNSFAFGDSGNDILMLKHVEHGYLVNNATSEAKALHHKHTQSSYNKGILETLTRHFEE